MREQGAGSVVGGGGASANYPSVRQEEAHVQYLVFSTNLFFKHCH